MSFQKTNFNRPPYFDDYNPSLNHQKVLFKAGFPLQARELNNLQSILQNQITSLSTNILKEGTVVIPGELDYNLNTPSLLVRRSFNGVELSQIKEYLNDVVIIGRTSGIRSKIITAIDENESEIGIFTLYLKPLTSSSLFGSDYQPNEILELDENINIPNFGILSKGAEIARTISENPNRIGSIFSVRDGIYYIRGYFVNVKGQVIPISQYSTTPTCKVGFYVKEKIITFSDEDYLLDNAEGYESEGSVGADRFQIECILSTREILASHDEDYIELARFRNGVLEEIKNETEYNIIGDFIAKTIRDINGNVVVSDFKVSYLDIVNNLLKLKISSGKAYIDGYEIERLSPTVIDLPITKETILYNNEYSSLNYSSYIKLKDIEIKSLTYKGQELILRSKNNQKVGTLRVLEIEKSDSGYNVYYDNLFFFSKLKLKTNLPTFSKHTKIFANNSVLYYEEPISTTEILVYNLNQQLYNGDKISINSVLYEIEDCVIYSYTDISSVSSSIVSGTIDDSFDFYVSNFTSSKLIPINKERPKILNGQISLVPIGLSSTSNNNEIVFSLSSGRYFDSSTRPLVFTPSGQVLKNFTYSYSNNDSLLTIQSPNILNSSTYFLLTREVKTNIKESKRLIKKAAVIISNNSFNKDKPYIGIPGVFKVYGIYKELPSITYILSSGISLEQGEIIYNENNTKSAIVVGSTNNSSFIAYIKDDEFNEEERFYSDKGRTGIIKSQRNTINYISDFEFVDGQTESTISYPYFIRKRNTSLDNVFIICDLYIDIPDGEYYSVSSYDTESYSEIPTFNGATLANYIDIRPIVENKTTGGNGTLGFPYYYDESFQYENPRFHNYNISNFKLSLGRNYLIYDLEIYKNLFYKIYINNKKEIEFYNLDLESDSKLFENKLLISDINIKGNPHRQQDVEIIEYFSRRYTNRDIEKLENRIENIEREVSLSKLERELYNSNDIIFNNKIYLKTGFYADDFNNDKISNQKGDYSINIVDTFLTPKEYNRYNFLEYKNGTDIKFSEKYNVIMKNYQNILYCNNDVGNRNILIDSLSLGGRETIIKLNHFDNWVDTKRFNNKLDYLSFGENESKSFLYRWYGYNDSENYSIKNKVKNNTGKFIIKSDNLYPRKQLVPFYAYMLVGNTLYDIYVNDIIFNENAISQCLKIRYNQNNSIFSPNDIIVHEKSGLEFRVISPKDSYYTTVPYTNFLIGNNTNYLNINLRDYIFIDLTYNYKNYYINSISEFSISEGDIFYLKNNSSVTAVLESNNMLTDLVGNAAGFVCLPENKEYLKLNDESIKIELKKDNSSCSTSFYIKGFNNYNNFFIEEKDKSKPNLIQIFESNDNQFISKINLYFQSIDNNSSIEVSIREVIGNTPSQNSLMYSTVLLKPTDIKINQPTEINFDVPVFVSKNKKYGVCIKTNGKARLQSCIIGDTVGSSFITPIPLLLGILKLNNNNSYVESPYEILKIDIFIARFSIGNSVANVDLMLRNKIDYGYRKLLNNCIRFTKDSNLIRIYYPHHGYYSTNTQLEISNVKSEIDNTIYTGTNVLVNNTPVNLQLANIPNNYINPNNQPVSSTNPGFIKIKNSIIKFTGINYNTKTLLNCVLDQGLPVFVSNGTIVEWYMLYGIPLTEINKTHLVTDYTYDEIIINLGSYVSNSTSSGGGNEIYASELHIYNHLYPNFYLLNPSNTNTRIRYRAVKLSNKSYSNWRFVTNTEENFIGDSHIIEFNSPQVPNFGIELNSSNPKLSPIIDLNKSSVITYAYRIGKISNTENKLIFETLPIRINRISKYIRAYLKVKLNNAKKIEVQYRTTILESGRPIESNPWVTMEFLNSTLVDNFEEMLYSSDEIQKFNQFQIRILAYSDNYISYPEIDNLRIINYQ